MYQLSVNKLKIASTSQTLDIITIEYLDNIESSFSKEAQGQGGICFDKIVDQRNDPNKYKYIPIQD